MKITKQNPKTIQKSFNTLLEILSWSKKYSGNIFKIFKPGSCLSLNRVLGVDENNDFTDPVTRLEKII